MPDLLTKPSPCLLLPALAAGLFLFHVEPAGRVYSENLSGLPERIHA
jgi:hypothetical protein